MSRSILVYAENNESVTFGLNNSAVEKLLTGGESVNKNLPCYSNPHNSKFFVAFGYKF